MLGDIHPPEIMARREDWQEGISLYMRQVTEGEGFTIASPIEMEKYEFGQPTPPFMRLKIQQAQQLMDELWQCGVRPTEGTGSAGSLRATEKHLADMRLIALSQLGINEEGKK